MQFLPNRKHYVSATKTNRLILFGETVAAYCENHVEHTHSEGRMQRIQNCLTVDDTC
jgi:hypothetical protein